MSVEKLVKKLQRRFLIVRELQSKNKILRAKLLGALAFKTIGGSYGKTLNPFPEFEGKIKNQSHSEFRRGFNETKKPKPAVIAMIHQSDAIINLQSDEYPYDFMSL